MYQVDLIWVARGSGTYVAEMFFMCLGCLENSTGDKHD